MLKANLLVVFLGFAMIILGMFSLLGFVKVDPLTLFGFSLAGLFLIIADLLEDLRDKKRDTLSNIWTQTLIGGKMFLYMFAGISIIVLPFIRINLEWLAKIDKAVVLIGFGISLMIMGFKALDELQKFIKKQI
ncbi:hypothetical protein [Peribacillus sp. R9-11]|uniref:hypothetical protein n=1 Tax=Peribacillus sp. R9-11 TaxID=3073271 RepID=UPI0028697592|nr:hypothetical protein [Peribacillus sp. R9-11]WMX58072.1 hypothetical protein RE409_13110 [Peribacillus sp. R9-11]